MPQPDQALIPKVAMDFPFADALPTPYHLLCLYDEDIRERRIINGRPMEVHPWQKEILLEIGKKRTDAAAIKAMLVAANGSGKSQYVLAPFAVWMALVHKESLTVITTASGEQLDTQANRYITRLCEFVNQLHYDQLGFNVFHTLYREFRNNITKSFIDLFATDEPRKAEGRHPLRPGAEFAIIVDEAKSVSDDIYEALERCKGATRRVEISSADDCTGYFYNTWLNEKYKCYRRKVTAFECPHITPEEISETIVKYGADSPFVRASIYSEFVSVQEQTVISRDVLLRCVRIASCPTSFGPLVGGLDLAAGGDESVLSVWNGNMQVGLHVFPTDPYTPNTVARIQEVFKLYKGKLDPANVNADDGGVGRGIIDQLYEKGLKVTRVLNQARPWDVTRYANRGTELWFTFKRFIEEYQVHFLLDENGKMDETLFSQLCHRYTKKIDNTGKIRLESKAEARKQGHPSPDRADATVLAWANRVYPIAEISGVKPVTIVESPEDRRRRIEDEVRGRLRQNFVASLKDNSGVNKNLNANGQYKNIGNFSFSHDRIFPATPGGKRSIVHKYFNE